MSRLTVDTSLTIQLTALNKVTELCDPSGRVLGRFIPIEDISEWEPVSPEASEEELDRREQADDWLSTDEMLDHLKKREQP